MDILRHPAAEWAPGDFDLPTEQPMQSLVESAPQYLQPAHQPQMRLPSISSSWFQLPQVHQSPVHLTFGGYDEFSSMVLSPPMDLAPLQLPHPPSSFWVDHSTKMMYPVANNDVQLPPTVHRAFRNPWQGANYTDIWANDSMGFSPDSTYVGVHTESQESPLACSSGHMQLPVVYSQDAEQYQNAASFLEENLSPMPAPQSTCHLPPSSFNGNPFSKSSLPGIWHANTQAPPTPMSQSPPEVQQAQHDKDPERDILIERNDSMADLYIHALCGKGFATLSGVKKHHWGKKANDLTTSTGCWAKHKKPDVAWDDHPSCKGLQLASGATSALASTSKQGRPKALLPQAKALAASDMTQFNTVPGFPTLDDLPKTVAKALSTGNASVADSEEWESRYHAHRLPSRSSFDTLLTAINMVSKIDAPKPEARTDSIALHLDAQVAATEPEQRAPFVPYVPSMNNFDRRSVRTNAPVAPDTKISAPGLGTNRRVPIGFEDYNAPMSLLRPLEPLQPLDSPPSGHAKKKRKV